MALIIIKEEAFIKIEPGLSDLAVVLLALSREPYVSVLIIVQIKPEAFYVRDVQEWYDVS